MKLILSAAVIVVPALGLMTGCSHETDPPVPRTPQNIEDAKRRNEDLRPLEEMRKESTRSQEIIAASPRAQDLRDARLQAKIERAKFNGKWVAIALKFDGREVLAATLKEVPWYWLVDDAKVDSKRPDSDGKTIHEEEIRIAIDPSKSPKTVDLTNQAQKEINKGIYEFDGDTLKICFAMNSDGERPVDFTAEKDSKRALMVWKRVKE
jgi:uncharacterized protein (TIGR03067 family)